MSFALPQSFSFEMLSRLPPQSFVVEDRVWRPDQPKQDYKVGGSNTADVNTRLRFHIRGAPNEMLLNTNCFVSCSVFAEGQFTGAVGAAESTDAVYGPLGDDAFNTDDIVNTSTFNYGPIPFKASRESFNSGALPLLDNQDYTHHLEYNHTRGYLAQRPHRRLAVRSRKNVANVRENVGELNVISPLEDNNVVIEDLESAGFTGIEGRNQVTILADAVNKLSQATTATIVNRGSRNYNIPLGFYSSLVNTHSVIPIGLLSSYSINGFLVELQLEDIGTQINLVKASDTAVTRVIMKNPVVYGKVVKILDPAVMGSILQLYEKVQSANVGGVEFPLSLRMNTVNYRFYTFPLNQGASDYHWRIPTTDKSVRAIMWRVANLNQTIGTPTHLDRLYIRAGSANLMNVVEDDDTLSETVKNYLYTQLSKCSYLFSPFPSYQEASQKSNPADFYMTYFPDKIWSSGLGALSLENLDRREGDHSGSFQASGIDMTDIGGFDVDMRFKHYEANTTGNLVVDQPLSGNNYIQFMICYDTVLETSPSGVMDVTSAVL